MPDPPSPQIKAQMDKSMMDRDEAVRKVLPAVQYAKYLTAVKKCLLHNRLLKTIQIELALVANPDVKNIFSEQEISESQTEHSKLIEPVYHFN